VRQRRKESSTMRIQRQSSGSMPTPNAFAYQLPPQILERAADGLSWISLICAVSSVVLTAIRLVFQPEFAASWNHPAMRAASLAVLLLPIGFILLQRAGWVSKRRLLDLGMVFQVLVAFVSGLFEGSAYRNPDALVPGISGTAVWMMLCGRLMPNAPLKSAIVAILCVLTWPLAYWVDLQIFGYPSMPLNRRLKALYALMVLG